MNKLKFTIKSLMTGCVLMGSFVTQAQTVITPELQWVNGLTGTGQVDNSSIQVVALDGNRNVITSGTFSGTVDFDPGSNVNELTSVDIAAFVTKYDSAGNLLWASKFGTEGYSPIGFPMFTVSSLMADKNTGDIYITGTYGDTTIDFNPGNGIAKLPLRYDAGMGLYAPTMFILKLSSNGVFQWVKSLDIYNGGGITCSAVGNTPASSENGINIYFSGMLLGGSISPYDFDPGPGTAYLDVPNNVMIGYLLCLNAAGEFVYVKKIAGGDALFLTISDMALNNADDIYIAGYLTDTADVDPSSAVYNIAGPQGGFGGNDMFLLKYDHAGDFQWARQSEAGSTVLDGEERLSSLSLVGLGVDANNGVYLTTGLNGPVNFNKAMPYGGASTLLNAAYYPYSMKLTATAIVKYNAAGDFQWVKQVGGLDTANRAQTPAIAVSDNGKVYLSGTYQNTVDLDPGGGTSNVTGKGNYIAQYDSDGSFSWAGKIAEGNNASALNNDLVAESDETVYMAGIWKGGSMDFDPSAGIFILTPIDNDNSNVYVSKLKISAIDTTPTGLNENKLVMDVKVSPNPTIGILNLELGQEIMHGSIIIHNTSGQTVWTKKRLSGKHLSLDITSLSAGIYYLELTEGHKKATFKLVKK